MKKTYLFLIALLLGAGRMSAGGGPDSYGYTWLDSNDAGGPTYNWVDITGNGTLVAGLTDDNSVGPFNIGFPFHYYWVDYTSMKVGSNGWLGFDNISNIASCFPNIPTGGGAGDSYIAPYMGDLIFSGAGNPAQCYYWSNNVDSFVVSYLNVPFWQSAAPGWYGSNTFQIILDAQDSSITFQYQAMNSTINTGCTNNVINGIESPTGITGLTVSANTVPAANYAVRFDYPGTVLLSIQDLSAKWNQNIQSGGEFRLAGDAFSPTANIANVGNTDVTASTALQAQLLTTGFSPVYTANATLPSLVAGDDSTFVYSPQANIATPGTYIMRHTLTQANDVNPANNTLESEIVLLEACAGSQSMSYTVASVNTNSISWTGGALDDGLATYMIPPAYPVTISSLDYYIAATTSDGYIAAIVDDDGPNGTPGTVLFTSTVPFGSVTPAAWNNVPVTPNVTITSGGFYVVWLMGGSTISLGTDTDAPISRRSFEILDGTYASFRNNNDQDPMIRANITGITINPVAGYSQATANLQATFTDTSANADTWAWDFGDGATSTTQNPSHTYSAPGTYTVCLIASNSCAADTICDTVTVSCSSGLAAGFGFSSTELSVTFSDSTSPSPNSYMWDFGDGTTDTTQNPSHTYSGPGTYTVCLIVQDLCEADTICQTVTVTCTPASADFSYMVQLSGTAVDFTDLTSPTPLSWAWDFGDGGTSTQQNPTHNYPVDGTYTVCLTITDSCGTDSTCMSVLVIHGDIEDGFLPDLVVYPNPNSGMFMVEGLKVGLDLELVNLMGQVVWQSRSRSYTETVQTGLPAGAYMLVIREGQQVMRRRVLIH